MTPHGASYRQPPSSRGVTPTIGGDGTRRESRRCDGRSQRDRRALARRFHAEGARVVVADLDADALTAVVDALNEVRPRSAVAVAADIGTETRQLGSWSARPRPPSARSICSSPTPASAVGTDLDHAPRPTGTLAFDVNVHAHRWAAKYLLPGWLARGEGYFCSTASAAGLLSQIGSAPYSLTKHAAVAFAEWMSITYGDHGVRVSCLCPQGVNTNMLNQAPTDPARRTSAPATSCGPPASCSNPTTSPRSPSP